MMSQSVNNKICGNLATDDHTTTNDASRCEDLPLKITAVSSHFDAQKSNVKNPNPFIVNLKTDALYKMCAGCRQQSICSTNNLFKPTLAQGKSKVVNGDAL